MTAKVLEFSARRDTAEREKGNDVPAVKRLLTTSDIFNDVYEGLIGDWQAAAAKNKLSEFIERRLPKYARSVSQQADYVSDLNVIAGVERALGMKVAVFYPECTSSNPYGWLAVFHRGKEVFTTAPDMASEAAARALNILLYLSFEEQLKQLGRA